MWRPSLRLALQYSRSTGVVAIGLTNTRNVRSSAIRPIARNPSRVRARVRGLVLTYLLQWGSLESHTAAPYTLTLKSNGCIIFIAALTPIKLVVTSKHSLGGLKENAVGPGSHAQVGERWLRKHLAAAGKTEEQLAQTLWEKNWTAVAEVRLPSVSAQPSLSSANAHSCATTRSKSTSSPTGPTRPGCTYTA